MLQEILQLAERLRPGYVSSLGTPSIESFENVMWNLKAPSFLRGIYSLVEGTHFDIKDQKLMDFIPGYRLIHLDELRSQHDFVRKLRLAEGYYPFLANYSSDFICWRDGRVIAVRHDCASDEVLHESETAFMETIREFYKEGVYFLDEDGFLDFDFERQGEIGRRCNPGVPYWNE